MNRCTGHCCQTFNLPYSPEHLRAFRFWSMSGQHRQVAGMAMYVGKASDLARARPSAHTSAGCLGVGGGEHYYTCRNYDWESGNCGIYEQRPDMCRDYPYGGRCRYPGCTWTAARERRTPYLDGRVIRAERGGRAYVCHETIELVGEREINVWHSPLESVLPAELVPKRWATDEPLRRLLPPWLGTLRWRVRALADRARWLFWRVRVELAEDTHWMRTP